jgi:hypothetical protein
VRSSCLIMPRTVTFMEEVDFFITKSGVCFSLQVLLETVFAPINV